MSCVIRIFLLLLSARMFNPNLSVTMKKTILLALFYIIATTVIAQVPQFTPTNYEGWIYTNPNTPLNQSNIQNNKIYLYKTKNGLYLTLTSPEFACHTGQVLDMAVTWVTDEWQNYNFDVNKVALTAAILDENDMAVDSVTYKLTPTTVSRTNHLNMSIAIPRGLTSTRLRFAAWKADVNNCGAIRQIIISSTLKGDVNQDGEVTVADVNAIIDVILGSEVSEDVHSRADVNGDNEISLADINDVIDIITG